MRCPASKAWSEETCGQDYVKIAPALRQRTAVYKVLLAISIQCHFCLAFCIRQLAPRQVLVGVRTRGWLPFKSLDLPTVPQCVSRMSNLTCEESALHKGRLDRAKPQSQSMKFKEETRWDVFRDRLMRVGVSGGWFSLTRSSKHCTAGSSRSLGRCCGAPFVYMDDLRDGSLMIATETNQLQTTNNISLMPQASILLHPHLVTPARLLGPGNLLQYKPRGMLGYAVDT